MKFKKLVQALFVFASFLSTAALAQIDIDLYKQKAGENTTRCIGARDWNYCKGELDYALSHKLITDAAYQWGTAHEFYPVVSRNNVVEAICKCGCFEENTDVLLTQAGRSGAAYVKVKDLKMEDQAWGLDGESTLRDLRLKEFPVSAITKSPEAVSLYVFHLANGRKLKLTQHHGTVLADGRVVPASTVTTADQFIDAESGETVAIQAITREKTEADVYNFKTKGDDKLNHIIVAEGVLVGELTWQNSLASELGEIHLRQ